MVHLQRNTSLKDFSGKTDLLASQRTSFLLASQQIFMGWNAFLFISLNKNNFHQSSLYSRWFEIDYKVTWQKLNYHMSKIIRTDGVCWPLAIDDHFVDFSQRYVFRRGIWHFIKRGKRSILLERVSFSAVNLYWFLKHFVFKTKNCSCFSCFDYHTVACRKKMNRNTLNLSNFILILC